MNFLKLIKDYWFLIAIFLLIYFLKIPIQLESIYEFPYDSDEKTIICKDTDFNSIYQKGICSDKKGTIMDKCLDDYLMEETSCYNNLCMKRVFRCQCIKGKCVPTTQ